MASTVSTLDRAGEPLTVIDGYRAMIAFLEAYWERGGKESDDLASLLGDISLDIWADSAPGDPASWGDWLEAIDRAK